MRSSFESALCEYVSVLSTLLSPRCARLYPCLVLYVCLRGGLQQLYRQLEYRACHIFGWLRRLEGVPVALKLSSAM